MDRAPHDIFPGLSRRSKNALFYNGYTSIKDLEGFGRRKLKWLPQIGKVSAEEIIKYAEKSGVAVLSVDDERGLAIVKSLELKRLKISKLSKEVEALENELHLLS